jgi:hypothetical protein
MKIREIVEVPHIDKIVRLTDNMSDKADSEKLKNLLKGYVITESVEKNLSNFFYKITNFKDKGHGFLISGLPGCGKSHFMSVLGLLIKNSDAFEIMQGKSPSIDKAKAFFKGKKIFVVPLMAEEGGPEISLEEMFFEAAENIAGFPFTDDSYYIKQFEEAIVANANYEKKVDEFVQKDSKGKFLTWADFKSKMKSSRTITKLIKSFINEYEITFFNPNRGRKDRLDYLYKWLDEENYDGILVLIDELSEYLNDRGSRARNDALFLKVFLENAEKERNGKVIPAWIVGAFLSSLNDIKVPDVYDLMKDRFPTENQFTLKVDDVEEIIDQRLIIKKKPEKVEEAFFILKNKYNAFDKVEKDTFRKIYPLHPETLDILSKSVRFLSRQRSIVDFVLSEVKGNMDEGGRTKGILDEDFLKLVTPDRILNHFQERIRELSDKREYFETIYAYYMGPEGLGNGKVKELFKDNESDRETACRLIDVMTLLKILDLEKEYTVRDLTYMIQYPKMEGDFAEEKVNNILFKMYDKGRFIEIDENNSDSNVGDNKYFINKDVSLSTKISQDMKKKLALIEGESIVSIVPEVVKTLTQEPLNISGYFNEPADYKINWNNTAREGVLQFNHLGKVGTKEQLSKALNDLKNSENDFYLYIGTIFESEKQKNFIDHSLKELNSGSKQQILSMWASHEDESIKEIEKRMMKAIVYWLPSDELEREEGKEKLQRIKEYYAYLELYKEYKKNYDDTNSKESKQLLDKVEEKILNLEDEVFQILKGVYLNGSFYNIDGKLDVDISSYGSDSLNKIVRTVIGMVLQQIYSSNKFICPDENLGLTDNATNKFINNYILGNKTDPTGIDAGIIRNIVKKFGEAHIKFDSFKFSVDAKNNSFIKLVIDGIEDQSEVIYKNLYNKVRKSTFGPDKSTTEILFAMMIKKGFLIPIKNDMPISIANVKAPLNTAVTKFKMGEFVDEKYSEGLMRITKLFFDKKFEKQDLSFQEEVWEELVEFKNNKLSEVNDILYALQDFRKPLGIEENHFAKTYETVNWIKALLEDIVESNGSKDGLEYFIEKNNESITDGTLENYYEDLDKVYTWFNSPMPIEIRKVNVTIKGYREFIPDKEEYKELIEQYENMLDLLDNGDEFIFGSVASDLNKKFDVFKNSFIAQYVEEHNRENNKEEFEELRSILSDDKFKFLKNLSQIERINMDYDYINIKHDIEKQLESQCNESPLKYINNGESSCICHFKLGQKKYVDSRDRFDRAVENAVLGYIDELNTKANREKVFKYINDLKEIGDKKDIIALVEKMYEIPLDDNKLTSYKQYLTVNPEIIPFIDKALKVNINFIQRDINKLVEIFKDKPYSKEEMVQKFIQLIEGNDDIKQNHYIKFTDLRNGN